MVSAFSRSVRQLSHFAQTRHHNLRPGSVVKPSASLISRCRWPLLLSHHLPNREHLFLSPPLVTWGEALSLRPGSLLYRSAKCQFNDEVLIQTSQAIAMQQPMLRPHKKKRQRCHTRAISPFQNALSHAVSCQILSSRSFANDSIAPHAPPLPVAESMNPQGTPPPSPNLAQSLVYRPIIRSSVS